MKAPWPRRRDAFEGRGVSAFGEPDSQGIAGAFGLVVLGRFARNRRASTRTIESSRGSYSGGGRTLDAQQIFLELVALTVQRALDDESQHPAEPACVDERLAEQHVVEGGTKADESIASIVSLTLAPPEQPAPT